LAHIDCPIIGDEKYGNAQPYLKQQIALHAYKLELPEAINECPVQFTAALPDTGLWSRFKD
jgi:23S rRNA pseudouridine1911/1915/1917 synthase